MTPHETMIRRSFGQILGDIDSDRIAIANHRKRIAPEQIKPDLPKIMQDHPFNLRRQCTQAHQAVTVIRSRAMLLRNDERRDVQLRALDHQVDQPHRAINRQNAGLGWVSVRQREPAIEFEFCQETRPRVLQFNPFAERATLFTRQPRHRHLSKQLHISIFSFVCVVFESPHSHTP